MSGTDDESLSLESLFAFVDGLSPHAEDAEGALHQEEPSAQVGSDTPEAPASIGGTQVSGATGVPEAARVPGPACKAASEEPEQPLSDRGEEPSSSEKGPDGAGEAPGALPAVGEAPDASERDGLALLSMVVQLPSGIGAPFAGPACCEDGALGSEEGPVSACDAEMQAEGLSAEVRPARGRDVATATEGMAPEVLDAGDRTAGVPPAGASVAGSLVEGAATGGRDAGFRLPETLPAGAAQGSPEGLPAELDVRAIPVASSKGAASSAASSAGLAAAVTLAELFPSTASSAGRCGTGAAESDDAGESERRRERVPEARPRRGVRGKHAADPEALRGALAPRAVDTAPLGRSLPSQSAAAPAPDSSGQAEDANPLEKQRRCSHGAKEPFSVDEARAAIEERLVKMVLERTCQMDPLEASPLGGRAKGALHTASPEPPGEGRAKEQEAVAAKSEMPAGPPACEAAGKADEPAAASGNEFDELAPDPEIEAIGAGPSIMFDEPPSSIGDSMRLAESEHRRGFAFKVAVGGAIGAVAVAVAALLVFNLPFLTEAPEGADDGAPAAQRRQTTSDEVLDSSKAEGGASGQGSREPERDLSGTVVYRYTSPGSDGEGRPTVETVSFGRDGLCETSTIEVELSDAEAAQAFVGDLERDFGSAYREGSAEGATARATVDVSANRLDREAYEDELRVSVEDLAIVKKS